VEEVALIFKAETGDLLTADNRLNKLNKTGKQTSRVQAQLGNSFRKNNSAIQNTAFQLQDIVVQLEAGVPVTRTLGQQLPQLLGGFGALGAVAGVVAGLGFALGGVLLSSLGDSASASDRLKQALEELDAVASATDLGVVELSDTLKQLKNISEEAFQASLAEGINDAKDAIRAARDGVTELIDTLRPNDLGDRFTVFSTDVTRLNTKFKEGQISLQDYRKEIDRLFLTNTKASAGFRDFREQVISLSDDSLLAFNSLQELRREQDGLGRVVNENQPSIDRLITNLQIQADAANDSANATSFYRAQQLGATQAELDRVQSLQNVINKLKEAEEQARRAAREAQRQEEIAQREAEAKARREGRAAEAEAAAANAREIAFQNRLFQTEDFLRSETQAYQDSYNERLAIIDAAEKKQLLTEEEAQKLRNQNRQVLLDGQLDQLSGFFGQFSALAGSENRKLFEIGKAANVANATIDGISAAISSYRFGADIGGPTVGAIFAAASAAATGALIGQMAAQQPPRAQGGFVTAGQSYRVGEFGPETFVPNSSGRIVPKASNDSYSDQKEIMVSNNIQIINNSSNVRVSEPTLKDQVTQIVIEDINRDGDIARFGQQRLGWRTQRS